MDHRDSVLKIIPHRKSVRTFAKKPLTPETLADVEKILAEGGKGPFGNSMRFWLVRKDDYSDKPVKLGTYGFISGARVFIAGSMEMHKDMNLEDYGYVKESKIISLTARGLGTCWVGGSFRRGEYAKTTDLKRDEVIPTISPVGYPARTRGIREWIIRMYVKEKKRKPWEELFFRKDLNTPLTRREAGRFEDALEMLRLAPSANNFQPWRVIKNGTHFHFFLFRKHSINRNVGPIDLQRIDMGIAMYHFESALHETGIRGTWEMVPTGILSEANVKYICSFRVDG
jgi:nitroreductase